MLLLIAAFLMGVIIATMMTRNSNKTTVETVVEIKEVHPQGGVFITNEQFIQLVEDIAVRVPHCTIRFNHNKVFFTKRNGEIELLTLKRGWTNITNNTRACGKPITPTLQQAPPPYEGEYIDVGQ